MLERLKTERHELEMKVDRLRVFMASIPIGVQSGMDFEQKALLVKQLALMKEYGRTLTQRIQLIIKCNQTQKKNQC